MIIINLDKVLVDRHITSKELASSIGITPTNLSILKRGKARGIRFNTLSNICQALDCQPGDILEYIPKEANDP
jgi:putative transcriptional regulator